MPAEPTDKRVVAFFDGQNLFHAVRLAFGYTSPNYDPRALAAAVCDSKGWHLAQTHFYTGVPDAADNLFWNHFWTHKLAMLGRQGVQVYGRPPEGKSRDSRRFERSDVIAKGDSNSPAARPAGEASH